MIGATEYKAGQILTDRAVYGKIVSPVIINMGVANLNVSVKALQVTGNILKGAGVGLGAAGLFVTGVNIYNEGLNFSNGTDFVMGCVGFVPVWGWAASGAYFIGKAGYQYLNEN